MKDRNSAEIVRVLVVVLLAVPLGLSGCRTKNVSAMKTYELVTNYDRMSSNYEPKVSLVYLSPDAVLGNYKTLVISPVKVSGIWVEQDEKMELFRPYINEQLRDSIMKGKAFKNVVVDPQYIKVSDPAEKIIVLETVVTKLQRGNGTARYFLQLGATDFQIEGRLVDARTQRVLMEFAERRRSLGESPLEPSVKTFNSEYTLKETIKTVTENLSGLLRELTGSPAPTAKKTGKTEDTATTDKSS